MGMWASWYVCSSWQPMSKTYKAIFTCERYDERVVWYVSSRKQASVEFTHHRNGNGRRRYDDVEYKEEVHLVFESNSDSAYDVIPFGYGA